MRVQLQCKTQTNLQAVSPLWCLIRGTPVGHAPPVTVHRLHRRPALQQQLQDATVPSHGSDKQGRVPLPTPTPPIHIQPLFLQQLVHCLLITLLDSVCKVILQSP
jgi:hypothetical protein